MKIPIQLALTHFCRFLFIAPTHFIPSSHPIHYQTTPLYPVHPFMMHLANISHKGRVEQIWVFQLL